MVRRGVRLVRGVLSPGPLTHCLRPPPPALPRAARAQNGYVDARRAAEDTESDTESSGPSGRWLGYRILKPFGDHFYAGTVTSHGL